MMFIRFLKDRYKNGFSWEDIAFCSTLIIFFWVFVVLNVIITFQMQTSIWLFLFVPLEVALLMMMAEFSFERPPKIIYI